MLHVRETEGSENIGENQEDKKALHKPFLGEFRACVANPVPTDSYSQTIQLLSSNHHYLLSSAASSSLRKW